MSIDITDFSLCAHLPSSPAYQSWLPQPRLDIEFFHPIAVASIFAKHTVWVSQYIYLYIFAYISLQLHTHTLSIMLIRRQRVIRNKTKKLKKKTFVNTFFQNRQRPFYSELFNSYSSERLFIHRYTINGHLAEFNIWVRHSSFLPSLQSTIRAQKSANNLAVAIQRRGSGAMIDEERRKYKLSV